MTRRARVLWALGLCLTLLVGGLLLHDPVREPVVDLEGYGDVPGDALLVEAWLREREARYPDITPGAEKHVHWARPDKPGRAEVALVYLPGFSATRQELSPTLEQSAASLDANVIFTRMRGHGRTGDAFAADSSLQAWAEDGAEALALGRVLGERVVLVGTSTGATLATWMAAEGAEVDALVLVSPNYGPRAAGSGMLLWPGRHVLLRLALGTHREWEPVNELQARYWTHRYPARAVLPMAELVELTERADLSTITAPILCLYSPDDPVVEVERIPARLAEVSSEVVILEAVTDAEDDHVLAGRILSPTTTDRIAARIAEFVDAEL